jgi:transposase
MQSEHILGIDVSKDNLVCSLVRTSDKERDWLDNFSNDSEGIRRLLSKLPADSPIVLEPTGWYGNALVSKAHASGHTVYLAPGRHAKAYQRSIQSRAKTDPKDSYGLALFGISRRLWSTVSRARQWMNSISIFHTAKICHA